MYISILSYYYINITKSMDREPVRLAVHGLGRIGRLVARLLLERQLREGLQCSYRVVHMHEREPVGDSRAHACEISAYLLEFDSVHGRWGSHTVKHDAEGGRWIRVIKTSEGSAGGDEGMIISDDSNISSSNPHSAAAGCVVGAIADQLTIGFSTGTGDPAAIAWSEIGVDVVVECTGELLKRALLQPMLDQGVRKIVVSAPMKEGVPNVVVGVNDGVYDSACHDIVTAASCTTNAIAPVVKVMHERFGIVHGMITTIHNLTNTQVVLDSARVGKKEIRRTRGAGMNLVPTTTGSAKAITQIFPELAGLLDGRAIRVPLAVGGSIADMVLEVKRATTVQEVNTVLREAAAGGASVGLPRGILGFESRQLVSTDYTNESRSGVVDAGSTMVTDGTLVKLYVWYDNEWGYSCRMEELVRRVVKEMRTV